MEQFVYVTASIYMSKIKTTVAWQQLPTYQFEKIPEYQVHSLTKDINQELFAAAESLVDKLS